jgi:hypothetical protein
MMTTLDVPDSTIKGFATAHGISLRFSRSLPAEHHQNFRNIYSLNA